MPSRTGVRRFVVGMAWTGVSLLIITVLVLLLAGCTVTVVDVRDTTVRVECEANASPHASRPQ